MEDDNVKTALDGLAEAVAKPLERHELGKLARMHSMCQVLARSPEPEDGVAREALQRLAASLLLLLERVILDEAARPDDGLALAPEAVAALRLAHQGQVVKVDELVARLYACVTGESDSSWAEDEDDADFDLGASAPRASEPAPQSAPATPPAASTEAPVETCAPQAASVPEGGAADGSGAVEPYVSEPLVIDLSETEHLRGFIDESCEHMDAIEGALLAVEKDPADTDKINELFRPFHTIKGIAGFLNLRDINRLTHEVETILDMGRRNELALTPVTIDRIFAAVDRLKAQIAEVASFLNQPQGETCPQPDIRDIMAELRAVQAGKSPDAAGGGSAGEQARSKLGEILVANEAATPDELSSALERQQEAAAGRKVGEILVEQGAVSYKQVDQALTQQAVGKVVEQSIRVDTAKLDALVDAVGELVIAQTMVNLSKGVTADPKLQRDVTQVTKIVRDVQETAMSMRMVPVGPTFQKMRRLVRDVARKAGKQVELRIGGEETELDKTVIQRISDPLVHMVRNSVDHGIEAPAERRAAGKPEIGTVYLNAYHEGDSIVIEIGDDGAGLDPQKLIAKGIERGVISPDDQLSEQQAFALIMLPGFSTAKEVTDISGRGVGMDVVRRNVDELRGKVEIHSKLGQGTTVQVRLPLTLAIIDGMLVRVGDERLIIPTILIEQSLRPQREQLTTVQRRGEMMQVRGELCPLIQLGQLFGYTDYTDPCETLVVIAHSEGQKVGLVVDELIGQQQVVIKSLAGSLKRVHGVSGAAILGDGRVGLIVEPTGLLKLHKEMRTTGHLTSSRAAIPQAVQPVDDAGPDATAVNETVDDQVTRDAADEPEAVAVLA
jgi:two-component system chemotaxis sensor kinase CheA